MKLGFSLKKTKKPALSTAASLGDGRASGSVSHVFEAAPVKKEEAKVFVTDFDPNAIAPSRDGDTKSTLVIPLLKTNEWRADANGSKENAPPIAPSGDSETAPLAPVDEDELAAQQLVAEVNALQHGGSGEKRSSTLVIPMDKSAVGDSLVGKHAELFNRSEDDSNQTNVVPILQQNAVPGLDQFADVTDKYRHDVGLRPDELDVHSDKYSEVPVEDFGAAMLRGMGWKGTFEEDKDGGDDPKPRQKLLGLGATAKPKLPGDTGKNRGKPSRGGDDKARANGLNRREDRDDKKVEGGNERRQDDDRDRDRRPREKSDRPSARSSRSQSHDRESARSGGRSSREDDRRRERSRSRDRQRRDKDRSHSRSHRDERDKRKRNHSRERTSDRKDKSSRR